MINNPSDLSIYIEPGSRVHINGEPHEILDTTTFPDKLLVRNLITNLKTTANIHDVKKLETNDLAGIDLTTIKNKEWKAACERYQAILPLLNGNGSKESLDEAIEKSGLSKSTLYNYRKKFLDQGCSIESLTPESRGPKNGTLRLSSAVERVINSAIDDIFLKTPPCSQEEVIEEVERLCGDMDLPIPSASTIRNRIRDIDDHIKLLKRHGKKAAQRKYQPSTKHFPDADRPGQVVQIDHTPADVIIVDDKYRKPIGTPWITIAQDIYSRAILSAIVSLEAPSSLTDALAISQAVLPKDELLENLNIKAEWPCYGIMHRVHLDNGSDFRSKALQMGCERHGIQITYRPAGKPEFGGHIERVLKTLSSRSHSIPGSKGSSVKDKGDYDAEGNAIMTMKEFEFWLIKYICNVYHLKDHSVTGMPPIKRWKNGFINEENGIPTILKLPKSPATFKIDFLPVKERSVQTYGIQWDLFYFCDALRPWIAKKDPEDSKDKLKLIVRRDPRDISKVWVYNPSLNEYMLAPCTDQTVGPISIWEYKELKKIHPDLKASPSDRKKMLNSVHELREFTKESANKTKSHRRKLQRQKNIEQRVDPDGEKANPVTRPKHSNDISNNAFDFEDNDIQPDNDVSWEI